MAKQNKIDDKCLECENEVISKWADCELERDKYKRYYYLVCECLDVKDELCKALRDENKNLLERISSYENR